VPVTLVGFGGGALLLTPVALAAGLDLTGDPVALATLPYLGTVPSAAAYALFFRGLQTVPGAIAGIVTLLEPVTATVLATALLGERLPLGALAGGALVLAAVAGLHLRRPALAEREAAPEPHR
jgi:DME family drug/metabolite transporter